MGGRAVLVAVRIGVTVAEIAPAVTYAITWRARLARDAAPRVWAAPEAAAGPAMTAAAATAAASGASNTGQRLPGRPIWPGSLLFTRPSLPLLVFWGDAPVRTGLAPVAAGGYGSRLTQWAVSDTPLACPSTPLMVRMARTCEVAVLTTTVAYSFPQGQPQALAAADRAEAGDPGQRGHGAERGGADLRRGRQFGDQAGQ